MLEENLNFCRQERIDHFLKKFMESEFMTINQELMKIILSQVGARKFRSTIQNQVVMGCKLFLFWHQVILALRSTRWNGLIGHPKDRGKNDLNSRASSFHAREIDVGEDRH
jgi:hypothetical protein